MKVRALVMPALLAVVSVACSSDSKTASTTTGAIPITEAGSTSAAPASDFCAISDQLDAVLTLTGTPEEVEAAWTRAAQLLDAAVAAAPAEIKNDVEVAVQAYPPYIEALRNAGWDPSKVTAPPSLPVDVSAANDRIDQYVTDHCTSG